MFVPFLILILLTQEAFTQMGYLNYPGWLSGRGGDLDSCGDIRKYYEGFLFQLSIQTVEDFMGGYEITTTNMDVYSHFQLTTGVEGEGTIPGGWAWADVLDVDFFEGQCFLKIRMFFPVRDEEDFEWANKYRCNLGLANGVIQLTEPHDVDHGFCVSTKEKSPWIFAGDHPYAFNGCMECNYEKFYMYVAPEAGEKWFRNFKAAVRSAWKGPMESVLVREPQPDGRISLLEKPAAVLFVDNKEKRVKLGGEDFEYGWQAIYPKIPM